MLLAVGLRFLRKRGKDLGERLSGMKGPCERRETPDLRFLLINPVPKINTRRDFLGGFVSPKT